jgi:hypothetical protein
MCSAPAALVYVRCFHHVEREAAVRCPSCGRDYCRECVSEHEDRLLCAPCLAQLAPQESRSARLRSPLRSLTHFLFGLALLWCILYVGGRGLLQVPQVFHEQYEAEQERWED